MTFRQLAFNNVRASGLRYAAYFLSCVFSVTLFFVYAQFILHPDVMNGDIYGGNASRTVLLVCEVLVGLFAFFFVLYSSGAFLRARSGEFGLLSLLGTTGGQLRRLIWLENTVLSGLATLVGIGLGLLLSRLFLMAIARVLGMGAPIRFLVVPGAVLLTALVFLVLFQLVTLAATLRVGRRSVKALLVGARSERAAPRASAALAFVGAALIAGGYVVAASAQGSAVVVAFLPVVAAVVVGTYLLLGHGSVVFLRRLQRRERWYLSGPRMLAVSQLVYKVRDNARLMATIASLSAVVLAGAGTFHIFSRQIERSIHERFPQALSVVGPERGGAADGGSVAGGVDPDEVEALLARHAVVPASRAQLELVSGTALVDGRERHVTLVATEAYRDLLDRLGRAAPASEQGAATLVLAPRATSAANRGEWDTDGGSVAGRPVDPVGTLSVPFLALDEWYLVDAADLARLAPLERGMAARELWLWDWRRAGPGVAGLVDDVALLEPSEIEGGVVSGRELAGRAARSTLGLSLFVGLFVSLLFFIGAGSLIYFKLFTELPEDGRTLWRLRRIGVTPIETGRLVTWQVATIFFLPFALGALHAAFALKAFGNLLALPVGGYTATVLALFALVQGAFYLLTRWTYIRQVERLAA